MQNIKINKVKNSMGEDCPLTLVLAGNPNVGKSVFFNTLTGAYVDVSNFPGTTVDLSIGAFDRYTVIDTPGIYGVSSYNDEERAARDSILYADLVLNVVDAVHIERDLFLTQQIIDMGHKVIVALNMMDEIEKKGIQINMKKLSQLLGVPVIPVSAIKNIGMNRVKAEIVMGGKVGNRIPEIDEQIKAIASSAYTEGEALMMLEEDENILERHQSTKKYAYREIFYNLRRNVVNRIVRLTVDYPPETPSILGNFGHMMLKPLTGIPLLAVMLFIMYQLIGVVIAQHIVSITEELLMGTYYYRFIMSIMVSFLDIRSLLGSLLIGEFGILTMVPIYILGLLLPLVIGFYLLISLLEDSGILPRIAVLVDRVFNFLGLNGRAVIPMILGFGCVTMAIITTRILGSKRERLIATVLLSIAIPCSAQLGIISGIAAKLDPFYTLVYFLTIFIVFTLLGILLNILLPGQSSELLMDIPPIRVPQIKNVLQKTAMKSKLFLLEAGPLFALGAIIITVLNYTHGLT
ncbi:MAG: ferrous iron transport protein B, partial [Peptostreptococcales bacterium]